MEDMAIPAMALVLTVNWMRGLLTAREVIASVAFVGAVRVASLLARVIVEIGSDALIAGCRQVMRRWLSWKMIRLKLIVAVFRLKTAMTRLLTTESASESGPCKEEPSPEMTGCSSSEKPQEKRLTTQELSLSSALAMLDKPILVESASSSDIFVSGC